MVIIGIYGEFESIPAILDRAGEIDMEHFPVHLRFNGIYTFKFVLAAIQVSFSKIRPTDIDFEAYLVFLIVGIVTVNLNSDAIMLPPDAKTEFAFHLDNDAGVIDALVHLVQQMVEGMGFSDFSGRLQIGVALKEALTNALYHGNLEIGTSTSEQSDARPTAVELSDLAQRRRREPPYRDRKIHVDVKLTRDEVRCVVRDQGPGFDPAGIPDVSDPNALAPESGRGLSLMRTFMDEVTYNEPGNEVTMTKRRASNNGAAEITGS